MVCWLLYLLGLEILVLLDVTNNSIVCVNLGDLHLVYGYNNSLCDSISQFSGSCWQGRWIHHLMVGLFLCRCLGELLDPIATKGSLIFICSLFGDAYHHVDSRC